MLLESSVSAVGVKVPVQVMLSLLVMLPSVPLATVMSASLEKPETASAKTNVTVAGLTGLEGHVGESEGTHRWRQRVHRIVRSCCRRTCITGGIGVTTVARGKRVARVFGIRCSV